MKNLALALLLTLPGFVAAASAIPEEAERRMARGAAAISDAKEPADYLLAAKEFEAATAAAPKWGAAYYNLGVAYDKAGKPTEALAALKRAVELMPNAKDAKTLMYQVEFRAEKAQSGAKKADVSALAGTWSGKMGPFVFFMAATVEEGVLKIAGQRYIDSEGKTTTYAPGDTGVYRLKWTDGTLKGVFVEGTMRLACYGRESPASATLSADGHEMTLVLSQRWDWAVNNGVADSKSCAPVNYPDKPMVLSKQ